MLCQIKTKWSTSVDESTYIICNFLRFLLKFSQSETRILNAGLDKEKLIIKVPKG